MAVSIDNGVANNLAKQLINRTTRCLLKRYQTFMLLKHTANVTYLSD